MAAGKTIKQMVQILFLYFGILPGATLIVLGMVFSLEWIAVLAAAVFHLFLTGVFFARTPLFIGPFGSRTR